MSDNYKYAQEWKESAQHFFIQGDYDWLAMQLNGYSTILELGCGTGQSTIALLKQNHKVIAVDKNPDCLDIAETLLYSSSISPAQKTNLLEFVEVDYADDNFVSSFLPNHNFDIITCWNVGTAGNANVVAEYPEIFAHFGFTNEDIQANPSKAYGDAMCLLACLMGKRTNVPVNIVFRSPTDITPEIEEYYSNLGDEMGFSTFIINSRKTTSLSEGGKLLSVNNQVSYNELIDLFLISVTLK
ncbi:MAG: class I SAM-dependent methyltransferase [Oscillospiraceae bacterium]|nr:class I SAM-dependent methyltransferase [Oscillospiraceae bacterium]